LLNFDAVQMLLRTLMLWSVRRIGILHVVQPTGQTFRKKSEASSGRKNGGGPEDKSYNQSEEAA